LPVEAFLFSSGGGFLLGAVAGYAIKRVMKIAAVVIGLFVAVLAYLSYIYHRMGRCKMGCNGGCFKKYINKCIRTGCPRT
jgi:hypothetical protein